MHIIHIYIYICLSISLSLYTYIYIYIIHYIYIYISLSLYIYIYIYIYTSGPVRRPPLGRPLAGPTHSPPQRDFGAGRHLSDQATHTSPPRRRDALARCYAAPCMFPGRSAQSADSRCKLSPRPLRAERKAAAKVIPALAAPRRARTARRRCCPRGRPASHPAERPSPGEKFAPRPPPGFSGGRRAAAPR